MSNRIVTHRGLIYPYQCDNMGHMNVMWYVGKFDEATWQFFAAMGLTLAYLREQQKAMAAVHQELNYLRELHAGDLITISSRMVEIREMVIRFTHEMRNTVTDEIAATTTLTGVCIDEQLRKSCPFPPALLERIRAFMEANPPE